MKISELTKNPNFKLLSGDVEKEISGCYIGDLLSLAMSKVEKDNVWLTIQSNINIVAVASLTEAGCIVLCEGFEPDKGVVERAEREGIAILATQMSAFETARVLIENNI